MRVRLNVVAGIAATFLAGGSARAAIMLTEADTFVQRGATTTNFGADTQINSKYPGTDNGGTNRKAFVRFNLGSYSPGTGSAANDVTTAILRLDVSTFSGGAATSASFNVFGILDTLAAENFDEATLTYATAPGLDDSSDGINNSTATWANGGAPLGTFAVTTADVNKAVTFSSQALIDFLNADTNNLAALVITRVPTGNATNDNGLNSLFASKENTTLVGPTLFVNQPVPEPGTAGVISLAAAAGGLLRRRRRGA